MARNLVPSSRGLGRRPLKPVTPVQIWSGLPAKPSGHSWLLVKTAVQVAVAAVVAWAAHLGIDFDSVAFEAAPFSIPTGVVAFGLNGLA